MRNNFKPIHAFLRTSFLVGTVAWSLTVPPAFSSGLDRFFESLGGQVNSTGAGSFSDQSAGYYTGGGYVMRQANSTFQPINISLPKFGIGCNAVDLYWGAFSFFKGAQLTRLFREIVSGVPTFAAQLFMKTLGPQMENLVAQIRKQLLDLNNLMMSSCQAAQQFVAGLWPKGTAADEEICKVLARDGGEDWFKAASQCKGESHVQAGVERAKNIHKDLLQGEYNLVWHALQKIPEYANNRELASFVMTLTGTLISRKEGERFRLRVIEPKADQKEFLAAHLKGGQTTRLVCDETGQCLSPSYRTINIEGEQGDSRMACMKARVYKHIQSLRDKYISKSDFSASEISFLNDAVNVPLYKYIQVSVGAGTEFIMAEAIEYIAAQILLTQFDRVMSEIIEAVDALQKIQIEDASIQAFKTNLQQARGRVHGALDSINASARQTLTATIQGIEQAISSRNV